jgi:acid stress-induced BolA-like protein IbaG/YrbA
MDATQVKQEIEAQLTGTEVFPEGEGCHFSITVVGDIFTDLTPVKRQQLVYTCLSQYIADGRIHAVTIKTYTLAQWQRLNE